MHIWDDKAGYLTFRYKKYAYVKHSSGTLEETAGDLYPNPKVALNISIQVDL